MLSGFANHFSTEAVAGALPEGRNSPQRPAFGLYTEQLSGTAFTAPRSENRRSWLYRMRPSAEHPAYRRYDGAARFAPGAEDAPLPPNRLRWDPLKLPDTPTDFIDGMVTMVANRDPASLEGVAVHVYAANRGMDDRYFFDADGELLIIPQQGRLDIFTEMGRMDVAPGEIALIPRGVRFRVLLPDGAVRGYVAENHGALFRLPELGPIGSNGLANQRDFLTPEAAYEDRDGRLELIQKHLGSLWVTELDHSPLDVVAWHGNLAPCKYDLAEVQHDRHGQLRPSRSLDLHRPHQPDRHARPGQCRFRHLPAALDGRRGHVPPALVPPQRDERVHGPDPRRL